VFDLEAATEPQVSPDGRRVVYARGFADVKTDKRYSSLWIVDAAGGNHRALTSGNFTDQGPRWSPDGTRIAFVSDRDGSPQVHVLWLDNGQSARITRLDTPPKNLAWAPDGRRIAFSAMVKGKALKLKGVESVLVRVPGEPHGIRVRPSHHVSKILHVVGWFERHRKTPPTG
jgi:Tol biopolymer transport system component